MNFHFAAKMLGKLAKTSEALVQLRSSSDEINSKPRLKAELKILRNWF
jgi:hypothetical protein